METRSLKGNIRPFYILALQMAGAWLIFACIDLAVGRWIGVWMVALLALIAFIALFVVHTRIRWRRMSSVIITTACPQCGKRPMDYKPGGGGDHALLICQNCQIQWDLGTI
jgi:hypothetical protein